VPPAHDIVGRGQESGHIGANSASPAEQTRKKEMVMGKGDKQHGNREAKKPKADKKAAPASASFLKPQAEARKPGAKPASK